MGYHTKTACKQLSSQQSRICLKITKRQIVLPIQTIYLGFRASKYLRIYYEIFKSYKKFHNYSTVFIRSRNFRASIWVNLFLLIDRGVAWAGTKLCENCPWSGQVREFRIFGPSIFRKIQSARWARPETNLRLAVKKNSCVSDHLLQYLEFIVFVLILKFLG